MVTTRELEVHSAAEFDRLPEDGRWEVAAGRAILLPGSEIDHQDVAGGLFDRLQEALIRRGSGRRSSTVNVDIPPDTDEGFRTRVPDLVVYERRPLRRFLAGAPPEVAIEILATRRGNVERTEKIVDYARAGIAEYWIVDPFERLVEVYRLAHGRYELSEFAAREIESTAMPGLRVDLGGIL